MERKKSVILNAAENLLFKREDEDLAKEAVSLLAITEDDYDDLQDVIISD